MSAINLCCILTMGLTQNILSYYLVQTENEGVRISCYVFSVIVWICMIPAFFYNWLCLANIKNSEATFTQKLGYITFIVFSKVLALTRQILFLAYYPSIIFISRDKTRFASEFENATEYVMPCLDAATLLMSLLHFYVLYQAYDEYTEFFEVTRNVND
jgi:hypothetical protein